MSFHLTSHAIGFDPPATIRASCRDCCHRWHPATFDLDRCLGNRNGRFSWGEVNFSHSARNVRFLFPYLDAELRDREGRWHEARVDVSDHIENVDGVLKLKRGGASSSVLDEAADGLHRLIFDPVSDVFADIFDPSPRASNASGQRSRSNQSSRSQQRQPRRQQPHPEASDVPEELASLGAHVDQDDHDASFAHASPSPPLQRVDPMPHEDDPYEGLAANAGSAEQESCVVVDPPASAVLDVLSKFLISAAPCSVRTSRRPDGGVDLLFDANEHVASPAPEPGLIRLSPTHPLLTSNRPNPSEDVPTPAGSDVLFDAEEDTPPAKRSSSHPDAATTITNGHDASTEADNPISLVDLPAGQNQAATPSESKDGSLSNQQASSKAAAALPSTAPVHASAESHGSKHATVEEESDWVLTD